MFDPIAVEFARFVLRDQPDDAEFIVLYDAMHRAATRRVFCGLGTQELAQVGVSFSLLNTGKLEALIDEARTGRGAGGNSTVL
jgi:hypothetical protein